MWTELGWLRVRDSETEEDPPRPHPDFKWVEGSPEDGTGMAGRAQKGERID